MTQEPVFQITEKMFQQLVEWSAQREKTALNIPTEESENLSSDFPLKNSNHPEEDVSNNPDK